MNGKTIAIVIAFLWSYSAFAQGLSIGTLSKELIPKAHAIKRYETHDIIIKSPRKATIRHAYAITILNEKGADLASFSEWYNQFYSITEIEGRLIDAFGKELKKVKKKDIGDVNSEAGITVSDTRYKFHSFYHKDYPYTVEYITTQEVDGMFYLPKWYPQQSMSLAVQQSRFSVTVPAGYVLRHKAYQYDGREKMTKNGTTDTYEWSVQNLPAKIPETMMAPWHLVTTRVVIAPSEFEIDGIKGNMQTWKDFGGFIYQLTKGKDELPAHIKTKVNELTAGIESPHEKINVLYDFLQKNTRYISVQLGIGGFRPFDANFVATKGYGDCKALSNYMSALLKEAGIDSKYAVINSGGDGLHTDIDFVHQQFDHAILCVPLAKDTMWLECTSNVLPAGYVGDHTYNRPALLIDEQGGTVVRTPHYPQEKNLQQRLITAKVDESGYLTATAKTRYTGLQQDDLQAMIHGLSKEKVMQYLRSQLELSTYDITRFKYHEERGMLPEISEEIDLTVTGYAQVSGKRLFLLPNIMSRSGRKLAADSARVFEINLGFDYLDTDTVQIQVPDGYVIESLPKEVVLTSKFGDYKAATTFDKNTLTFIRSVSRNSGFFPANDYAELSAFYQAVYKADRVRAVLKKAE